MILAAGLTPAWQQVLVFDNFTPGRVNRARAVHWCASGKVLNVARALHHLGAPARALTVLGGVTGQQLRDDCARLGIPTRWVEAGVPTRVCTTILSGLQIADCRLQIAPVICNLQSAICNQATELVPEAGDVSDAELAAFLAAYAEEAAAAAVVVLLGSLPARTPPDFYRALLARTPGRVILDARGPELLEALAARPFLVKPNREELGRTLGRALHDDADLLDAMRELNRRGADWVVITDGANPAHVTSREGAYLLQSPPASVVNPIGCGDCMAAGIARALDQGLTPLDAVRYGMAAAADKLGRLLPGQVERGQVEERVAAVEVTRWIADCRL